MRNRFHYNPTETTQDRKERKHENQANKKENRYNSSCPDPEQPNQKVRKEIKKGNGLSKTQRYDDTRVHPASSPEARSFCSLPV